MKDPRIIFGRLGNSLFQYATLYAHARELGTDFYFQDEKYFKKYESEIKELFSEGIGFIDYVAIHVRRNTNPLTSTEPAYSDNPFYVNLSKTNYYEEAMSYFPYDKFIVFSDDPDFCKKKWKDNPRVQVLEKGNEIEDFNLMASCKGFIIANSSYSWWAAWLSPQLGKQVIAPSKDKWYSDGIERTFCPKEWVRI